MTASSAAAPHGPWLAASATTSAGRAPSSGLRTEASWQVMSIVTPPPARLPRRQPWSRSGSRTAWKTRTPRTRPTAPSATRRRIVRWSPEPGRWWLVARTTPARSHAAIIARPSSIESASGFSHRTCLPAAAASSVCDRWRSLVRADVDGVHVIASHDVLDRAERRDVVAVGVRRRPLRRPRADGDDLVAESAHRGDHPRRGDVARTEQAPADGAHVAPGGLALKRPHPRA